MNSQHALIASPSANERLVESALYALLRRLAPALSHDMAGALQPLSILSMVLEKRLNSPSPDHAALATKSSQFNKLTREASSACADLMSWLGPANDELFTVSEGVADAAATVKVDLAQRGFNLINRVGDVAAQIPRSTSRGVFAAALLALTDAAVGPANVVIHAELVDDGVVLVISLDAAVGHAAHGASPVYRMLGWEDVQALAGASGVKLTHATGCIKLHCALTGVSV